MFLQPPSHYTLGHSIGLQCYFCCYNSLLSFAVHKVDFICLFCQNRNGKLPMSLVCIHLVSCWCHNMGFNVYILMLSSVCELPRLYKTLLSGHIYNKEDTWNEQKQQELCLFLFVKTFTMAACHHRHHCMSAFCLTLLACLFLYFSFKIQWLSSCLCKFNRAGRVSDWLQDLSQNLHWCYIISSQCIGMFPCCNITLKTFIFCDLSQVCINSKADWDSYR